MIYNYIANKQQLTNYRPISVTSFLAKVFEKIMCNVLRTPTVPRKWYFRKWDFSYGTSSCITYFKLKEHLTLIK